MLPHPNVDQISLPHVLAVLGDQTRLAILGDLARRGDEPLACAQFKDLGSKSNLSYHFAKMREAGIILPEDTRAAAPKRGRKAPVSKREAPDDTGATRGKAKAPRPKRARPSDETGPGRSKGRGKGLGKSAATDGKSNARRRRPV